MGIEALIVKAVQNIVGTVAGVIDKGNYHYTVRQNEQVAGRTSRTLTRSVVMIVAIVVISIVLVNLSKSK